MKHNKGFSVIGIILIIVGVLIVGCGAYYLGSNNPKLEDDWKGMKENLRENNKKEDFYPKVFEYGDKENQLFIAESELGDHPAPEILGINKSGNILFHDKDYGLKLFLNDELKYSVNGENLSFFRNAFVDNSNNIYVLNDHRTSGPLILIYDKNGNEISSLNDNKLKEYLQKPTTSLYDKLYVFNNKLYLYSGGSENSYQIADISNLKDIKNIDPKEILGKYGMSGDLFFTRINTKTGYDYLKVIQSNGEEKEFSFKNERATGFFFLNEDKNGNVYAQSDSCDLGYTVSNCISKIYKINKNNGNLVGLIELPKDEYLSYNDLLVDEDGNIFYLNLQKDKAYLEKYIIE